MVATSLFLMWTEIPVTPLPGAVTEGPAEEVAAFVHERTLTLATRWLMLAALAALIIGWGATLLLSRSVIAPIRGLTSVVQRMVAGDLSVRTSLDREDELNHLGEAINDVAKQMETTLREQRRESIRLHTLLNGMQDGVCLTDGGGQIALSNRAFDELFATDATGRPIVDVIRHDGIRKSVWSALGGADTVDTVEMASPDGDDRSLFVQASALAEEGGAVIMIHDVTPLRRADRIRRDFVANASHELRTPLTAIRGFAETLRDGAIDNPEQARRFVDVIIRNAMRLQVVADDLLHLSKAEAKTQDFDLGPVKLQDVLVDLGETFSEQAKQRGVLFDATLDGQPVAFSNAVALDHILVNLINNAFKVSRAGDTVTVRCYEQESVVHIDVSDRGPGIPEKHLSRIFERFYRVDRGRAADGGGTGLGLAIVKHLAERIGAKLDVKSTVGKGSTFSIRLPRFDPQGDSPNSSEPPA